MSTPIHTCACGATIPLPVLADGSADLSHVMRQAHCLRLVILHEHLRIAGKCRGCNRPFVAMLARLTVTIEKGE